MTMQPMPHKAANDSAAPAFSTAPESVDPASFEDKMGEVSELTQQLNKILSQYKSVLTTEDAATRLKLLHEWGETYRQGLSAADALAKNAHDWVSKISDKTRLAAEEVGRLDNEGGPPPSREQAEKADALFKASHKLDQVASSIYEKFGSATLTSDSEE